MQRLECRWSGFFDRVRDADQPGNGIFQNDEHHSFALIAPRVGGVDQRTTVQAQVLDQCCISQRNGPAVNDAFDAFARHGFEVFRLGELYAALFGAAHDGLCQWML